MCKARALLAMRSRVQCPADDYAFSLRADLQGPALLDRGSCRLHAHAAHSRALPGHLLPTRGALAVHDEAHGARAPGGPRAARRLDASGHRAGVHPSEGRMLESCALYYMYCMIDLLGSDYAGHSVGPVLRDGLVKRHAGLREQYDRAAGAVLGAHTTRPVPQHAHDHEAGGGAAEACDDDDQRAGHDERVGATADGAHDLDLGAQLGALPAVRRHLAHVQLLLGAPEDHAGAVRHVPARRQPRARVHSLSLSLSHTQFTMYCPIIAMYFKLY